MSAGQPPFQVGDQVVVIAHWTELEEIGIEDPQEWEGQTGKVLSCHPSAWDDRNLPTRWEVTVDFEDGASWWLYDDYLAPAGAQFYVCEEGEEGL